MALEYENILKDLFEKDEFVRFLDSICKTTRLAAKIVDTKASSVWEYSRRHTFEKKHVFPVCYEEKTIGELWLSHEAGKIRKTRIVDQTAQVILSILEMEIYREYELNSLSEEILEKYEEVNLLYDISESLGAIFELGLIYEILLDEIVRALNVEKASILSYDKGNKRLVLEASRGLPEEVVKIVVPVQNTISGYVLQRGEPLLVDDVKNLPNDVQLNENGQYSGSQFISVPMICSPVKVKNEKIGIINVTDKKNGRPFSTNDLKLLNTISSIAAISIYNARLIEELKGTDRVKHELEIAETIQKSLLPSRPPVATGLDIYGACKTAKNVGGDYFDYFKNEEGLVDIIIADVSGHSIGSALMMAIFRSVLRSVFQQKNSVSDILYQTNKLLFPDLDNAGLFISAFLGQYNPQTRWFTYGNAGHPPLLVYKAATRTIIELDAEGMIIGILDQVDFEEKNIRLDVGDIVVFYTDGIIEAVNPFKEQFGQGRLAEIIKIFYKESAEEIVKHLYNQLDIFVQRNEQEDDVTVIVVKIVQ
ncbi:phosphoserine phosphatase RsbU [bacterium BMS3Abin05]|nr:phosphoserine phosphatase RsbU [bacterium BMS3Abin05]GBE28562.1 phosphoserine phosphatase RsbU [bacterium BMS3Bbin03]HDL78457.1 GAF domain-containing protein [Bacteroidota bacterium]HDZ12342.1 GAF domain-containing protein [Bacteroidota bacterium]